MRKTGANALDPSTLLDYNKDVRIRILEVDGKAARLRDIPLTQLTRRQVSAWYDDIAARFKPTSVLNTYKRLHTALEAAVDRDMIPENPAARIKAAKKKPKRKHKELPPVNVLQEIVAQLDYSVPRVDGTHKLNAILTFFHGLRISESLALRRMDIVDLGDPIIARVRGNCYRTKDGMVRKDTVKTDAGYRDVEIFPAFHSDVRYHLEHFVGGKPDAMLFTTATGAIVLDASYRSILNRAKKRAGYENMPLTPHYGRNFIITTLAKASMPIPAIGEILGQRDTRTITEVYTRATEEKKASVLAAVNDTFKVPDGVADLDAKRAAKGSDSEQLEQELAADS